MRSYLIEKYVERAKPAVKVVQSSTLLSLRELDQSQGPRAGPLVQTWRITARLKVINAPLTRPAKATLSVYPKQCAGGLVLSLQACISMPEGGDAHVGPSGSNQTGSFDSLNNDALKDHLGWCFMWNGANQQPNRKSSSALILFKRIMWL